MNIAQSTLSPEALAHKWNQRFPVGTPVRYWLIMREGCGVKSKTLGPAHVIEGAAVVLVEGVPKVMADRIEGTIETVLLSQVEPA